MEKRFRKKKWHAAFFSNLEKYGTITAASTLTGISRMTYYREIEHEEFRTLCDDADRRYRDSLTLRVTTIATDKDTPKHLQLAALEYLIDRADKRLDRGGKPEVQDDQPNRRIMTIMVDAEVAKSLFVREPLMLLPGSSKPN